MRRHAVLAGLAALPFLAACSGGGPTREALAEQLTNELVGRPPCFATNVPFPYTRRDTVRPTEDLMASLPELAALQDAGLIKLTQKDLGMFRYKPIIQTTAELTELGRSAYHAHLPGLVTETPGFCGGQRQLGEVRQFTPPGDSAGFKVTNVEYTFRTSGLPSWMKNSRLRSQYLSVRNFVEAESTPAPTRSMFVRTEQGWLPSGKVKPK
ncbi:MAG TPA: hypothetical protein VFH27_18420 [Longimicrobiaceae bacterium]|nr:hypothetical protein [Longimicrobiaceae bacterium]